MSKKATEFQKKEMSKMFRGKEIFKPLNTGWVDEHVACVREWVRINCALPSKSVYTTLPHPVMPTMKRMIPKNVPKPDS